MTTAIPHIVIKDFHYFTPEEKKVMIKDIEIAKLDRRLEEDDWDADDWDDHNSWTTSGLVKKDSQGHFATLYDKFEKRCKDIFGDIPTKKSNDRRCFGLTRNRDFFNFDPHTHDCCEINAVYYLNIPPSDNPLWGSFWMTEDIEMPSPWDYVIPEEGMLILMPSWVYHDPWYVPTKEQRVSINMELQLEEEPDVDIYHQYMTLFV